MGIGDITLGKIAAVGVLFNPLASYNASLAEFRNTIGDRLDFWGQDHRDAMMDWLDPEC
jgi:hypothetical protein